MIAQNEQESDNGGGNVWVSLMILGPYLAYSEDNGWIDQIIIFINVFSVIFFPRFELSCTKHFFINALYLLFYVFVKKWQFEAEWGTSEFCNDIIDHKFLLCP